MSNYIYPVGVSDFYTLVKHRDPDGCKNLFVDKTLFIRELLKDGSAVVLFTRPRRFGKTLMLTMLQYFLANNVNGKDTSTLFTDLDISKNEAVMKYQGKYPVIFISFKDIKAKKIDEAKNLIILEICSLYNKYKYLLPHLDEYDKKSFESILNKVASEAEFKRAILNLSEYLYAYHKVAPFLLIDEYDTPIQSAYVNKYYEDMVVFMRGIFSSSLKDNPNITKAVLTGITRVSKESLFSGVNNFKLYTLFNNKYSEYFGFTESDVKYLLSRINIPVTIDTIRSWYNGYKFGDDLIYNPWSIINLLSENGKVASYWINSSDNKLVIELLLLSKDYNVKNKFESLLRDESITETIDENLIFDNLGKSSAAIWNLLLMAGYLKVVDFKLKGRRYTCRLKIPNEEIKDFYTSAIADWLSGVNGDDWYTTFLQDLLNANLTRFADKLQEMLTNTFSFRDVTRANQENFYHGFVLGLIATLQDTHILKSNRESGNGIYDVAIIPKDKTQLGVILEFKAIADLNKLQETAKQALEQINSKQYESELTQLGINKILKVGVAFSHKNVAIEHILI